MPNEFFTANLAGQTVRLGMWMTGRRDTPRFEALYQTAASARRTVESFLQAGQMLRGNDRLSDSAKREDTQRAARERLGDIGKLSRELNRHRREVEAERAQLLKLPAYGDNVAQVLIDLRMADFIRDMDPSARSAKLMTGADPDMVRVALQLPPALTGITPEFRSTVLREAVFRENPAAAQNLSDAETALANVEHTLTAAFKHLAKEGGVSLDDQVAAAGDAESAHMLRKDVSPVAVERIAERLLNAGATDDGTDDDERRQAAA
ncbi:hypothetical protein [Aromatoleum evansii]|uniref:hypothetical protein n=1 Tax=Aromatoleum evansii TaxID=59406 RepID=UPI00145FAE1E|nr:hypothetical protein [Aromatoleum evansii]NMG32364.1 hypothetical protein [Aromatoleum evansii]